MKKRAKLIKDYYKNKIKNVEILIDNVWDPHNAAAVLRSADGLGIGKVLLYYTFNKFPDLKKIGKRSSASANKWIPLKRVNLKDLKRKKEHGYAFISIESSAKAKNLLQYKFPKKCVLVLGSEKQGISPEIKKLCKESLFIPMVGMVKSYNISVAAGILFYELFRQRGKDLKLRK